MATSMSSMPTSSNAGTRSATGHRRRSRPNSLSSSSVVTIVSRARTPDSPNAARPATSPLGPAHSHPHASSAAPHEPVTLTRSMTALDQRRLSGLGSDNPTVPRNRWSHSSTSSVSSSGKKASLAKRLSFRGSKSFGSWRNTSDSPSPPREKSTPSPNQATNSPPRNFLSKTRLPPSTLSGRPSNASQPTTKATMADAPVVTLPSLSQAVDDCDSPATPPTTTPATAELLTPSTYAANGPDYFGKKWQGTSPPKQQRPTATRTATAPAGVNPGVASRLVPQPDPLRSALSSEALNAQLEQAHPSSRQKDWDRRAQQPNSRSGQARARGGGALESPNSQSSTRRRARNGERTDRVPSQKAMLSKALHKANTAVLLDNAQNFEGAMEAYSHACALLQQVMKRSPGGDDKRKLDAIRNTYSTRIIELQTMPLQAKDESKALPARPESDSNDPDSSLSLLSDGDDEPFNPNFKGSRTIEPSLVPRRRESLLPSAFEAPALSKGLGLKTSRSPAPERTVETSIQLRVPMEPDYMPPPLSPRRPASPKVPSPERTTRQAGTTDSHDPSWSGGLRPQQSPRAASTESVSWLDTIDESGSSLSSVHSRSSSLRLRRKHIRAASGDTEAEFDAALDAAVEAAYDDGFEPAEQVELDSFDGDIVSNARRNVELAKERVREAEREAAIQMAKERQKGRMQDNAFRGARDSIELEYGDDEAEEEERMLEEMTRGFVMDDSEYDLQSKSALPRQSDSSGFSGRTWGSSIGSNPTTAATSLQTLAEAPVLPSLPSQMQSKTGGSNALPPPSVALPTPPTPTSDSPGKTPAANGMEAPPSPPGLQAPSVRARRLSARLSGQNQKHKPLKIETSAKVPYGTQGPLTEPGTSPSKLAEGARMALPPKTAMANTATPQLIAGSILKAQATAVPHTVNRQVSSPIPTTSTATDPVNGLPSTPALSKTMSQDSESSVPPLPQSGSPSRWNGKGSKTSDYLRKIHSSSSLKTRHVGVSSPEESDPSPSTPQSTTFPPALSGNQKGHPPSVPALPTPSTTAFTVNGLPTGGLYLFDSDIHSPHSPGSPNPLATNAPVPLEPCPSEAVLRPFWLMRCVYQTIVHPRGGYISTKLFVPTDVWRVKGVKLKNVEEKISNCDLLTAALLKLGKVDTFDADAVLEEMQSLELVLDQVQATLAKKLGSDVGLQGSSALLKDTSFGNDAGPNAEAVPSKSSNSSSKASYLSWKRLRSKNSGAGLTNSFASAKETNKEGFGPSISSLPMTSAPMTRPVPRRDINQVQFTGPNATYMSSLARLFDAAQTLDSIARQVEDPGLKHSSPTHVGLELSTRHAAEFFGFYVCRFALTDMSMMLDKFIKRGSEWVLV